MSEQTEDSQSKVDIHISVQKTPKMSPSDCLICALRPASAFCRFNVYTVDLVCPHSHPVQQPQFRRSKIFSRLSFLSIAFLLIRSSFSLTTLPSMKRNEVLSILTIVVTSLGVAITVLRNQKNLQFLIHHANGLLHILSSKDQYGIEEFLGLRFQRSVYSMLYQTSTPFVLMSFVLVLLSLQNVTAESMFKLANLLVNVYTNLSLLLTVLLLVEIYGFLFVGCHNAIKNVLAGKCRNERGFVPLEKLHTLQMEIFTNFQRVQIGFGATLIILCFCGCAAIVLEFFLVIDNLKHRRGVSYEEFAFFVLHITGGGALFSMIIKMQQLYDMGNDVISFIFRQQLSKLNRLEIGQVIVGVLTSQKPELNVSDIFTVRKSLVASISGTIVTYVLVAVQFQNLWNENQLV